MSYPKIIIRTYKVFGANFALIKCFRLQLHHLGVLAGPGTFQTGEFESGFKEGEGVNVTENTIGDRTS